MAHSRPSDGLRQAQAGDLLVVVHDFDARSGDELTLRRGERVQLVELDDGFGDGWYLGRHIGRGGTGLFPGVYTTKVPNAMPSFNNFGAVDRTSMPAQSQAGQSSSASAFTRPDRAMSVATSSQYTPQSVTVTNSLPQSYILSPITPVDSLRMPDTGNPGTVASPISPQLHTFPRNIGQALGEAHTTNESPVMNDTLDKIDEHITGMNTPRESVLLPKTPDEAPNDSESEYSSHHDSRRSYAGAETDDEDEGALTVEDVKQWDFKRTAAYLRSIGVDPKHCDIFEEQEISGDVLLEMDQAFIYMKEYDFGVMGKRLKTWHKVRDFQEEVKGPKTPSGSKTKQTRIVAPKAPADESGSFIAASGPTLLPTVSNSNEVAAPTTRQSQMPSPSMPQPLQMQSSAPSAYNNPGWRASVSSASPSSPSRPSAALVRAISHSRRHSSMEFAAQPAYSPSTSAASKQIQGHQKQASFDRSWSLNAATPMTTSSTPSLRLSTMQPDSLHSPKQSSALPDPPSVDPDRGYFSGGELDSRSSRNTLRKKDGGSATHSRQSSMLEASSKTLAAMHRRSRIGSADTVRDMAPLVTSPAAQAYHSRAQKGRFRSSTDWSSGNRPQPSSVSPTVTSLEGHRYASQPIPFPYPASDASPATSPSTSMQGRHFFPEKARRVMGLRAISDAITGHEKAMVSSPVSLPSPVKESPIESPSRTASSTPSVTSRSFEIDNTDSSSKGTEVTGSLLALKTSNKPRAKTKKETSAYTRGLLMIGPVEARKTCDHSGWMKKKSASLMTTWKPRLFILRGRRLSYYYSEDDTQERGIIDIAGHKVLVANNDPITTLHATLTGATSSSNALPTASLTTAAISAPSSTDIPSRPSIPYSSAADTSTGLFYFKLVPPKANNPLRTRAVQFTKPTVHYFQCENLADGRKWMGELMKATIEHELGSFETSNKQKTISLKAAQRRRERPPALKDEAAEPLASLDEEKEKEAVAAVLSTENGAATTQPSQDAAASPTKTTMVPPSGLNIKGLQHLENDANGTAKAEDSEKEMMRMIDEKISSLSSGAFTTPPTDLSLN